MLSRVADSLYWMARSIERAENLARIIDVNLQLLLDVHGAEKENLERYWRPIILSTGDEERFDKLYDAATMQTVTEFLSTNPENPSCIRNCIGRARENARMVRDQISDEVWESLNSLHLFLRSHEATRLLQQAPYDFFERILHGSYLLQGMIDCTVPRIENWEFIRLGKFLERADKTTRVLDILSLSDESEGFQSLQSVAILRSCSGYHPYRRLYGSVPEASKIVRFLLFSNDFPRSTAFCIRKVNESLHRITGVAPNYYSNDAERLCGRLLADLNFGSTEEVMQIGLHTYLDTLQTRFNEIGNGIFNAFIHYLDPVTDGASATQQQQQQQ